MIAMPRCAVLKRGVLILVRLECEKGTDLFNDESTIEKGEIPIRGMCQNDSFSRCESSVVFNAIVPAICIRREGVQAGFVKTRAKSAALRCLKYCRGREGTRAGTSGTAGASELSWREGWKVSGTSATGSGSVLLPVGVPCV